MFKLPAETWNCRALTFVRRVNALTDQALHLLFPEGCRNCGRSLSADERFVCQDCWKDIELIEPSVCPRCGQPFGSEHALSFSPQQLCALCRLGPLPFDTARAVGHYRGVLREIIHLFKYRGKIGLGPRLGSLMADQLFQKFADPSFDCIVSVPLHEKKLKLREFDQSRILAEGLSRGTGVPMEVGNLVRTRWTESQVGLSRKDREKNVRGAFGLKDPSRIKGRRVLLLDDVYTTGATIAECATVLKEEGTAGIDVFTLARV